MDKRLTPQELREQQAAAKALHKHIESALSSAPLCDRPHSRRSVAGDPIDAAAAAFKTFADGYVSTIRSAEYLESKGEAA